MPKSIYSVRQELMCKLLIDARLNAGLTQQEVADQLGQPQSYVAKIEGGERRLDVIEYIELCEQISAPTLAIIRELMSEK